MARNDGGPDEARRAQDVDVPGITIPESTHHTGRGKLVKVLGVEIRLIIA